MPLKNLGVKSPRVFFPAEQNFSGTVEDNHQTYLTPKQGLETSFDKNDSSEN
jgi:hypothetical protein